MKTNSLKEVTADRNLIAYCGIYCGACGSYFVQTSKGNNNEKAR